MPIQSKKNPLAGKLANSLKKHANDETTAPQDFTNLPPGIVGGVAELAEARRGVYAKGANEGQPFIYLAGIVKSPVEHTFAGQVYENGKVLTLPVQTMKVFGLRTSLMLPLCKTVNGKGEDVTQDENVSNALNSLRLLGGDECTNVLAEADDPEAALDELLTTLKDAGVRFKFSTRSSIPNADYPNPRTWETWRGAVTGEETDGEVPVEEAGVIEEKEEAEAAEEQEGEGQEAEGGEDNAEEVDWSSSEDLDALGDAANEDSSSAQTRIEELAEVVGVGEEVAKAGNWIEAAAAVKQAMEGEPEEEKKPKPAGKKPPAKKTWSPEKSDTVKYKPPKAKKAVECEVKAVFPEKKLVNLKDLDSGKEYKAVKFSEVSKA